jgi:hypothetical protein
MFKPNQFKVGQPILIAESGCLAPPTNLWRCVPAHEILDSFKDNSATYASLTEAREQAAALVRRQVDSSELESYECPIFEVKDDKFLYVHFQDNKFNMNYLITQSEQSRSMCTIL